MEEQKIVKIDDNTISVTKSVPIEFKLTPEYLTEQRIKIVEQKEKEMAQRDAEIAEIDNYLAEMDKLNIKPKETTEVLPVTE